MKFVTRSFVTGMLFAVGAAMAQQFPSKPVTLMVPYPAGGPSDSVARILSAPMSKELGQQVLVENLGGVGGALAAQKVLSAPADGHYLLQGSANEVILSPLANAAVKLKSEDFRLVAPVVDSVIVLLARKDLPANSMDDLITLARKSPGSLTYGSVGVGSLYHLMAENIQQLTDTKFVHAPYKGNAPLLQDIGGGQLDFAILVYNAAMGAMADQGRLKVIGQFGAKRSELLKSVPVVAEGNELSQLSYKIWSGIMVPKNTPEVVMESLHKAISKVVTDPGVRSQLAAQTQEISPQMSLKEAAQFYESEAARYRAIARAIKLQPQ